MHWSGRTQLTSPRSFLCSNGIPSCAHPWLLTSLVRDFWGRPDATHVSDCGAIEDEFTAKGCACDENWVGDDIDDLLLRVALHL